MVWQFLSDPFLGSASLRFSQGALRRCRAPHPDAHPKRIERGASPLFAKIAAEVAAIAELVRLRGVCHESLGVS
jgi:hypothetical protein